MSLLHLSTFRYAVVQMFYGQIYHGAAYGETLAFFKHLEFHSLIFLGNWNLLTSSKYVIPTRNLQVFKGSFQTHFRCFLWYFRFILESIFANLMSLFAPFRPFQTHFSHILGLLQILGYCRTIFRQFKYRNLPPIFPLSFIFLSNMFIRYSKKEFVVFYRKISDLHRIYVWDFVYDSPFLIRVRSIKSDRR